MRIILYRRKVVTSDAVGFTGRTSEFLTRLFKINTTYF